MHKWLCLVLTLALSGSAYAFPFRSGGQLDGGPTLIASNVSSVFDEGQSGTVGVFIRESRVRSAWSATSPLAPTSR